MNDFSWHYYSGPSWLTDCPNGERIETHSYRVRVFKEEGKIWAVALARGQPEYTLARKECRTFDQGRKWGEGWMLQNQSKPKPPRPPTSKW